MRAFGRTRAQRFALRVLLYGSAIFVGLPFAFSYVMTRAHPTEVSSTPATGYEAIELESSGLRLRAWIARGNEDRAAFVIVHGLGDTLESYLGHARPLVERGHTVLLLDLRGHGGSEGRHTTLGGLESEDVRAAIQYLRDVGLAAEGIVLMGHSMGSVAVLLAAAGEPGIRAVIVEAPYDTYRDTVTHHAKLLYHLPSWVPIIPLSVRAAEWRAGFDADEVDAVEAALNIDAPLLAIVDGLDERMPETVVRRVVDAHPGPHVVWVASGVHHVGAFFHPDWNRVVLGFLSEHGVVSWSPES